MASIKVKFRPSTVAGKEGTIYYQVIHERKTRQLLTDYHVFPSEWDGKMVMALGVAEEERKMLVLFMREKIRWEVDLLVKIDGALRTRGGGYTADEVIEEFKHYLRDYSLFHYMEAVIAKLKQNGRIRTAETYKSTLNSFKQFRHDEDIMLDCVDSDVMEAFEAWHRNRGIRPNTFSFYARILRAVYNRAVEDGAIINRRPFRHVYTGVGKTIKRALPLEVVKKIKGMDLSLNASLDFARDMFMMSFYLRGMSFVDMAYLKKTDLRNGYITYRRRKTGQLLTIEWTSEMQSTLDKYAENESDYLLPIIKSKGISERCAYRNVGYKINRSLKQISCALGLNVRLTMYVARHSWASAAKAKGIPLSVISAGMGHDSEATTQIYLASLDTSVVDNANAIILKSLK